MTLPKTFTLTSTNFNNFDTMSFEAGSTLSATTGQNRQQLEQQLHQEAQHQHVQHTTTNAHCPPMSTTSVTLMQQNTNAMDSRAMFSAQLPELGAVAYNNTDLLVENVMPGIYLTKDFISWKREQLKAYGFTHVIVIDKHIQELYYPNQQPDIFKLCSSNTVGAASKRNDDDSDIRNAATGGIHDDSSSLNAFDYYCPSHETSTISALNFGKDFEVINLNFGEKSYLTTVLPNCYRAVKFINKALQSGGTILVIDCNGGEQKCLTIIVAYLMYKHNISFSNAFDRLKEFYKKADLDRFYISQLYEYEPILQVQRAQSRGHSCSRELHAAILKRKKPQHDDDDIITSSLLDTNISCSTSSNFDGVGGQQHTNIATSKLLNNCNPLTRFDTTQMEERRNIKIANRQHAAVEGLDNGATTFTRFMSGTTTGGWYNWDDYAME